MEGLRSCVGDGARFIDAVWIVSAIWRGMEEDILGFEQVGSFIVEMILKPRSSLAYGFDSRDMPRPATTLSKFPVFVPHIYLISGIKVHSRKSQSYENLSRYYASQSDRNL